MNKSAMSPTADEIMRQPLRGVRVVDLTHVLAGPYCTTILADLGADVIKVERVGLGDMGRRADPLRGGESYNFVGLNRNKRSVALDLKNDAAKQILERLVQRADVLVENFRPGVLESLGFGSERLLELNSKLIVCSISGFGQSGPMRDQPAFDLVAQAIAGVMSLTGEPGRPPVRAGVPIGDILPGVFAVAAIASALNGRIRSGRGCFIDMSMFDCLLATQSYFASRYFADGDILPPVGSGDPKECPYGAFEAADGYVAIGVYGDHFWPLFCEAAELPDLAVDPQLKTAAGRVERREEVESAVGKCLKQRSVAEWCEAFSRVGIPNAPVLDVGKALDHPQTLARRMILELQHQKSGNVKVVGSPINVNGRSITESAKPAPMLGEHTEQVLSELGYDEAIFNRLRTEGVIGA
ncbi:CoA transferase [Bradyrhizobium sp. B124]|uniref:CaiB/BaiF CoA transferase family protein n=1 Tax=Bradyrhizobium sp. B124 TaxID=3140245 RepID=UPI003183D70A